MGSFRKAKHMNTRLISLKILLLWAATVIAACVSTPTRAQSDTNPAPNRPVTRSISSNVRGAVVYSISFPGGSASAFFDFLSTNGFASDNVLFAGRAAQVWVPPFTVSRVRLKDVAKSLELVTGGRLNVEVVENGPESDENIWRIKMSESAAPLKARSCAMPYFFRTGGTEKRVGEITEQVERLLNVQSDESGRAAERGITRTLTSEKMVVVVGSEAYVEAVSSALEAAEKVAAGQVLPNR